MEEIELLYLHLVKHQLISSINVSVCAFEGEDVNTQIHHRGQYTVCVSVCVCESRIGTLIGTRDVTIHKSVSAP